MVCNYMWKIFGVGSQHVSYLLKKYENRNLEFIDNTGVWHVHSLIFEHIQNSLGSDTMEACIHLGIFFI